MSKVRILLSPPPGLQAGIYVRAIASPVDGAQADDHAFLRLFGKEGSECRSRHPLG